MKSRKNDFGDHSFWLNFANFIWEKKSLTVKKFKSPLLQIDEAEIFSLLVQLSNQCRKSKNADGFKFYVDGQKLYDQEILQILPQKSDASLLGYHQRMEEIFSDYCLVCDELLQVSQSQQALLSNFTKTLYSHVGFPNRFAEMGLYLGNYRKTPFGVHVDACGVFSFPVVGTKRFRLWTPAFVEKNPKLKEAHHYTKYLKSSKLLTVDPGDMAYWPSKAWHIAESNGSFSATWSLGVWVDRSHQDVVSEILRELVTERIQDSKMQGMTSFRQMAKTSGQIRDLPDQYLNSISNLRRLSRDDIEEAFEKAWVKHLSKQGFKTSPAIKVKYHLKLSDQIFQNKSQSLILYFDRRKTSKHLIGFNGALVETGRSKELLDLILSLNSGEKFLISQFLKKPSRNKDLKALQTLFDAGAFQVAQGSRISKRR